MTDDQNIRHRDDERHSQNQEQLHRLALTLERLTGQVTAMGMAATESRDFVRDRLLEFQLDSKAHRESTTEQLKLLVTRVEFLPVKVIVYGALVVIGLAVLGGMLGLLFWPRTMLP